jgi:hypothetical protein
MECFWILWYLLNNDKIKMEECVVISNWLQKIWIDLLTNALRLSNVDFCYRWSALEHCYVSWMMANIKKQVAFTKKYMRYEFSRQNLPLILRHPSMLISFRFLVNLNTAISPKVYHQVLDKQICTPQSSIFVDLTETFCLSQNNILQQRSIFKYFYVT